MNLPFIIVGGGGHALVVLDTLESMGCVVRGYCDPSPGAAMPGDLEWFRSDDALLAIDPSSVVLACGVGSTGNSRSRKALFERFSAAGFRFPPLRHASAIVSRRAVLSDGAQVMMGACIQPGTRVGRNTIVNTGARVDHDCRLGDHVHIAPGAVLAGSVTVEDGAHVGAGATVIQNKTIAHGGVIGAGACVIADTKPGMTYVGVPARPRASLVEEK